MLFTCSGRRPKSSPPLLSKTYRCCSPVRRRNGREATAGFSNRLDSFSRSVGLRPALRAVHLVAASWLLDCILSDQFLAEVRELKYNNVESHDREAQSSAREARTLPYHNRAIATQEVIEEPGKCRVANLERRTD